MDGASTSISMPFELHVRFTEGEDVTISVHENDLISFVKEQIKRLRTDLLRKHLRLIYNGRILHDDQTLLNSRVLPSEIGTPIYVHCSFTDMPISTEPQTPQISPPTGFDRLREAGFSEEDIQHIRAQFHHMHGTIFNGETTEQTRILEEQWIENAGETLPDGTLHGTYKEMVWGLFLGFFMGLITLFYFREAVFTRRQQIGIVAGILINISYGILHVYY